MNRIEQLDIMNKIRQLMPMLVFMVGYMIWFALLEQAPNSQHHVIYSPLDSLIPFCEYFIIPYFLWFLLVPACLLYVLFVDETEYQRLSRILMAGMLFFLISSTVYPTALQLRPTVMPNDNIFCQMVAHLYASDTPTNVAPSIHVFNTLAIADAMRISRGKLANKPWTQIVVNSLSLLIIMSTMLLKQHSVWDVISAFVLFAGVVWCMNQWSQSQAGDPAAIRQDYAA